MKKRCFSLIITLCMIISLVPVSSLHVHASHDHSWAVNEEKSTLIDNKKFNLVFECTECELPYPTVRTKPAMKIVTQEATCDKPELSTFYTDGFLNGVEYTFEVKDVETAPALGHNFKHVKSEAPTCTEAGYDEYECVNCGDVIQVKTADKLGEHNYEVVKMEPATCKYPAYYWYECSECGAEMNREEGEADASAHGAKTIIFTKEANCSEAGFTQVKCAVCEDVISETILEKNDSHFFYNGKCLLCGETDECKHDYVLVKEEAATCEYPAYYWYECSKCGNEMNHEDTTGKLGEHNYEVVKTEEATCQYPAYYWFECTVCGAEKNHEDTTGKLGEHNYEVVKMEPATCQYPAYYWYECSECGAEMNREEGEADASAHGARTIIFTKEANCSEAGFTQVKCAVCEDVISETILEKNDSHFFYDGKCLLCGDMQTSEPV